MSTDKEIVKEIFDKAVVQATTILKQGIGKFSKEDLHNADLFLRGETSKIRYTERNFNNEIQNYVYTKGLVESLS